MVREAPPEEGRQGLAAVFVIRSPRPDDAEVLATLHSRTWEETYGEFFPPQMWGEEALARRIHMWTELCAYPAPGSHTAVAEIDGDLVGFAHVGANMDNPAPRDRQLWFIYLLQSAQGSGAGQALLDEVLADEPASLWVLEENPRARAFYARNRFVEDGARKPTGFERGGDELRMLR